MVRSSGQHKCGLIFCGIMMLFLGAGITTTGFINDFLDPYDNLSDFFTHTQYWLGIPLLVIGFYVTITACSKVSCMMAFGTVVVTLVLLLSLFAVILEGPGWREVLQTAIDCHNDCDDKRKHAVIYTFNVGLSGIAILICLFCNFIYFRILGWMSHISYDDPIDDYYAKAVNSHFINGHHGRGVGRVNDVAMGTYPK